LFPEWITWIDTHLQHSTAGTENFYFEANRALYAHGHILDALKRLNTFAEENPKSDYAIPSASLVLDTFIVTADWQELLKKTEEYLDVDEWKNLPFHKRLFVASADASYKMVENQAHLKNYPETLKMADAFLKKYKTSDRFSDTLVLAGATALESKQSDLAFQYFTRLINEAPKSSSLKDALLARASIEESRYALSDASRDYSTYLKLSAVVVPGATPSKDPKKDQEQRIALEKKILAYTWINGNWADLKTAIESKEVCSKKEGEKDNFDGQLVKECERYQALGTLTHPELFPADTDAAFDRARKEDGELAGLWAAVALEGAKSLAFRDRLLAVRHFAKNWDELDPLTKLTVLPYVNTSIIHALELDRKMMDQAAPLRVSGNDAEKYITHRVDLMREIENAVTLAMKLPWARIKAESLNELAATYLDFSTTLAAAQPKGLKDEEIAVYQETIRKITVPFEEKGQDLRMKAFQLASRYAVEQTAMQDIAQPFFQDNPSQAKALRKIASVAPASGQKALYSNPYAVNSAIDLDIAFLEGVDPSERWKKVSNDHSFKPSENVVENIQHFFIDAVTAKNWSKAAYYLQEAKAKNAFAAPVLSAMKSVVLSTAGAKAEALLEIEDTRGQWVDQRSKIFVLGVLAKHYEQAYATERAESFNKEIEVELTPKVQVTQK
jgi:hypothetical protein